MRKTETYTAKDRILEKAYDLFYRQGFQATGINQIIEESGVAKATFYAHFPSKDDLAVVYLRERGSRELGQMKDNLRKLKSPHERYRALMRNFGPWMKSADFRGCAFSNIAAEVTDVSDPIRKEVKYHDDAFRAIIRDVVADLAASSPKYRNLDVDYVAESYYLIARGALSASQLYHETWPIQLALRAVEDLIR